MERHSCKVLIDNTQGLMFTESPRWRDAKLWFPDNYQQLIKTVDLEGRLDWDGHELTLVADLSGMTTFCLSDRIVDGMDRLYIGNIGFNFLDHASGPVDSCVIVCVQPDGSAGAVADGLTFPNGLMITPDGRTLSIPGNSRRCPARPCGC